MDNFEIILWIVFVTSITAFTISLKGTSILATLLTGALFLSTGLTLISIWYKEYKLHKRTELGQNGK